MVKTDIPKEVWEMSGKVCFVFTNFQDNNYGTSSGEDEENCVYNCPDSLAILDR